MIVDAIQTLAQILTRSSPTQSGQADRQTAYQMQLTPGQQVQAEVMASLPNQRFLARIAGKLFNIELSIIVQPGETLELTFVTGEPHLTFALSRAGNSSTPVTISDTGRLLNQLTMNSADPRQTGGLTRNSTILNGPPADTSLFAGLLGEALTLKGIFYESHLLQWFLGERQARELLKEPQGKLSSRGKSLTEGKPAQKSGADGADGFTEEALADELICTDRSSAPVDPRTVSIVREQLEPSIPARLSGTGRCGPGRRWNGASGRRSTGTGKGLKKTG